MAYSARIGELAQLGERLVCNQEVTGSSPVFSTMSGQSAKRRLAARQTASPFAASGQQREFVRLFDN